MAQPPWRCLPLVALAALSLRAEENVYMPEEPGRTEVVVSKGALSQHRLPPAEASAYLQRLTRLRDLIMAKPLFQHPVGATLKGYFRVNDEPGDPKRPVPGFAFIRFHPMVEAWKTRKPVAFIVSTWELEARINVPMAGLELMNELEVPLYMAPQPTGEVDGLTVHGTRNGNELLVFTRSGRLPWVPVTTGEYADLVVEHWRKLAQEPYAAQALQPFVSGYEAWRASLTSEQRRQQARHGLENAGKGLPPGPLLVKPDPAVFDPALPRSAFQVLTLVFDYGGNLDPRHPEATKNPAPLRLWQALHHSTWADVSTVVR